MYALNVIEVKRYAEVGVAALLETQIEILPNAIAATCTFGAKT